MAFEMICGQCRGNLLVEHFGVIVACPHCGAHLHVPDPAAPAEAPATEPSPAPIATEPAPAPPVVVEEPVAPAPLTRSVEPQPAAITEETPSFTGQESEPPPSVEISVAPTIEMSEAAPAPNPVAGGAPPAPVAGDGGISPSTPPAVTAPIAEPPQIELSTPTAVTEPTEPPAVQSNDVVPSGLSGIFGSSASAPPPDATAAKAVPEAISESDPPFEENAEISSLAVATSAAASASTVSPPNRDQVTVSRALFAVLISYASAMTLGFGWLLYQMKTGGGAGLEALPDPVPAKKTGFQWYPPRTVMTAGHNLEIGDSQRFGNIKVTVLKVTRGPIKFRHFSNADQSRRPTFPVLKLWLRFENVSEDQEIAPLDDQLLFRRSGNNYTEYKSSQFVCRLDEKNKTKPKIVIAYDHVIGSGWDLANLPLEKPLAPHESREYYVPTCEQGLDDLVGNLVWRVHIRKGYSARGNGVTTLFEVHFDSRDIHDEQA